MIQDDNTHVHETSSMKTWFAKFGRKEHERPDLKPNEYLWDELEHRPPHP